MRHNPREFAAELCRYARAAPDLAVAPVRNQVYAYKGRTIERFVLFVGYGRSGSTLIGALLNAHPEMVVSNELHVLECLKNSKEGRGGIVRLILNKERKVCKRTCSYSKKMSYGYAYGVKNQWQGKYSRLRVIGDKMARLTCRDLYNQPGLFDSLCSQIGCPVRVLFICRNPYDMIPAQYLRQRHKVDRSKPLSQFNPADSDKPKLDQEIVSQVLEVSAKLAEVLPRFQQKGEELLSMRYEDFIASPREKLREICTFLGVECTEDYLTDCAAIVYSSPHQTRFKVQWTPGQIQEVAAAIKKHPHLEGYAFDAA